MLSIKKMCKKTIYFVTTVTNFVNFYIKYIVTKIYKIIIALGSKNIEGRI